LDKPHHIGRSHLNHAHTPRCCCRLLLLDVHSSNRDKDMFARLRSRYPTLLILFVPANCTSLLQPLDVHFNGPIKRCIKALAATWLAELVLKDMGEKLDVSAVKIPQKLSELKVPNSFIRTHFNVPRHRTPHAHSVWKGPFCKWLHEAFQWAEKCFKPRGKSLASWTHGMRTKKLIFLRPPNFSNVQEHCGPQANGHTRTALLLAAHSQGSPTCARGNQCGGEQCAHRSRPCR
jgi:hypothetical protein